MKHSEKIILSKIINEVNIALLIQDVSLEKFEKDELLKRGLAMTVINIGELVKNLSFDFKKQYKAIPWREIAGFRDIVAHKYESLSINALYYTVKLDYPQLKDSLSLILNS